MQLNLLYKLKKYLLINIYFEMFIEKNIKLITLIKNINYIYTLMKITQICVLLNIIKYLDR